MCQCGGTKLLYKYILPLSGGGWSVALDFRQPLQLHVPLGPQGLHQAFLGLATASISVSQHTSFQLQDAHE